ncbi:hypothetical protein SADUNF_SadunfMtG0005600 (mitochondrion) [Salix dunnii]|uniref:Uncharacterized protein n=1 Tax=Salix dunnii TaxID=1413687 RepID=A0A835J2Y3_9ROSI|nr:hypothetical protein SADUNF_SadunfMtG0005600 [Salix dunnii]
MPLRGGYLIKERWEVGEMPLKITYPVLAGFDLKNTRRSYHNGGSWPVLLILKQEDFPRHLQEGQQATRFRFIGERPCTSVLTLITLEYILYFRGYWLSGLMSSTLKRKREKNWPTAWVNVDRIWEIGKDIPTGLSEQSGAGMPAYP